MSDVYVVRLSRERFIELSQWVSIEGRPEHPERQKLLEEIARAAHWRVNNDGERD